jgi:cyclic pyranopterin phosphate synthase
VTEIGPTPLVDSFGRVHRDLRIAVTDRCSFRCTYCMPAEGMDWLPRSDLLTFEEIGRLARLLVDHFGFESVRLTGGEPTVRAHLPLLVAELAPLGVDVALTTNGASLGELAQDLADAGLDRVNVSLDSLRPERFEAITRRDALDEVIHGIDAAVAAGLTPVKVNAVVQRGVNDDEIVDLARFGRDRGLIMRFLEFMPLDADERWDLSRMVRAEEMVERIHAAFPIEPMTGRGSAPAERWRYLDGAGEVGIIPTVTRAFCDDCDRVRLTAEGALRSCLFALDEHDLRGPLRAGASDEDLVAIVRAAVAAKWAGHRVGTTVFVRPGRSMSQIGG